MSRTLMIVGFLLPFVLSGRALGQDQPRPSNLPDKPNEPPRVLPDGCSVVLVEEMRSFPGTDGYRFLRRELEAFPLGHIGRQQISAAMIKMPQATQLHRLAMLRTGMTDAMSDSPMW